MGPNKFRKKYGLEKKEWERVSRHLEMPRGGGWGGGY